MPETFANNSSTTLSGTINNAVTSLVVASAASFPTSGNFRILIDDEIMIVTGVAGTTFTVTRAAEGTTAASHTSGVDVYHVLTKGAMEVIVQGPSSSTDYGVPLFDSTGGKLLKASTYQIDSSNQIKRTTTNAPVIVAVNGTSALLQGDTGGNTRGAGAVDLQISRTNNTEVASGANSAVIGGADNTANQSKSGVFVGDNNFSQSPNSAIVAGYDNNINAASGGQNAIVAGHDNLMSRSAGYHEDCTIVGGADNTIRAESGNPTNVCIIGGRNNFLYESSNSVALGAHYASSPSGNDNSVILGRYPNAMHYNTITHGGGSLNTSPVAGEGDVQSERFILSNETTNNTQTPLYLNGKTATKQITIPDDTSGIIEALIIGQRQDGTYRSIKMYAAFQNDGTSLTVASPSVEYAGGDSVSWNMTFGVSGSNLRLLVTGESGHTIRWMASCHMAMLKYEIVSGSS